MATTLPEERCEIRLPRSLEAWGSPGFEQTLKQEVAQLPATALPLQQGLVTASYVSDSGFEVMVISSAAEGDRIRAKLGIFYGGIIAGCSCADDPTPVEEQSEYCVVCLDIDRTTGQAQLSLCPD